MVGESRTVGIHETTRPREKSSLGIGAVPRRAQRWPPDYTPLAAAARWNEREHHVVADLEVVHVVADLGDDTAGLMAEHKREWADACSVDDR
ncbi:hypothetical protein GCM10009807_30710 [Microbacterium lacus]|uniref:Uncharacterized protein n=1 Tax=Microbacterium lacus TaxID=415217 RepID=A0ABN2HBK7_9MICO